MSDLLKLASECDRIVIPSRELDLAIDCEVRPREWSDKVRETRNPGHPVEYFDEDELPRYTASLDAAMTLVPEGWAVGFKRAPCQRSHAMLATIGEEHNASGATPALALCAASLRARAKGGIR